MPHTGQHTHPGARHLNTPPRPLPAALAILAVTLLVAVRPARAVPGPPPAPAPAPAPAKRTSPQVALAELFAPGSPCVLHAEPDNGDVGVDPAITEIRITFDRDMNPAGHSICGQVPITARPSWPDPRTLLLPVKLAPDTTYAFSINCPAAQNTRSARGVPARIYPISFRTAAAGQPPTTLTPDLARDWTASLRNLIATRYAYRDRLADNWDALFAQHRAELEASPTPGAFARAAARLLEPTQDLHLHLRVDDLVVAPPRPEPPPLNMLSVGVRDRLINPIQLSPGVLTGLLDVSTPYVLISAWDTADRAAITAAIDFVVDVREAPSLIVDVRPNAGGDELLAREFAALFLDKPAVYARNRTVDPDAPTGWTPTFDRTVNPAPHERRFPGHVALLIGPVCMSANESFITMMQQSPRVRTFGGTTRGSSGNPKPHQVGAVGPHTLTIVLPSWQDFTAAGVPIEGHGIQPDEPVSVGLNNKDHIVDAALRWLERAAARNTSQPSPSSAPAPADSPATPTSTP